MPKYKIIKGDGLEAVIEKTEHEPTQFEAINVKNHLEAVEKTIEELEAKIKLEEAIITNIENNHPGIKVIDEELKQACYLSIKSKMAIIPAKQKLDELNKSMDEYKKELKEIKSQTGINIWKKKK